MSDDCVYALTWHAPGDHPVYWSLTKGWVYDADLAWALTAEEVEDIETDERLFSKLPQFKERKEGANWEPMYTRYLRPGVISNDDDDEDDERNATSTGD